MALALLVVLVAVLLAWRFGLDADPGGAETAGEWKPWPDTWHTFYQWPYDKAWHLGLSFALAWALCFFLRPRDAFIATVVAGILWEVQQRYSYQFIRGHAPRPGRFSWLDIAFDAAGAALGALLGAAT
jgi:hypothetical protein